MNGCRSHIRGMQDLDRDKQTVRSLYEEVLSAHRLEKADELFTPGVPALAEFRSAVAGLLAAFPDIRYTVLDLVAEGERIAVRFQWTGTFRERFMDFAPTQASVTASGM